MWGVVQLDGDIRRQTENYEIGVVDAKSECMMMKTGRWGVRLRKRSLWKWCQFSACVRHVFGMWFVIIQRAISSKSANNCGRDISKVEDSRDSCDAVAVQIEAFPAHTT